MCVVYEYEWCADIFYICNRHIKWKYWWIEHDFLLLFGIFIYDLSEEKLDGKISDFECVLNVLYFCLLYCSVIYYFVDNYFEYHEIGEEKITTIKMFTYKLVKGIIFRKKKINVYNMNDGQQIQINTKL